MPLPSKDEFWSQSLALMTLIDTGNVLQRGLEKRLSGLKLSVAQQRLLALTYLASEPLTPSMLAALLLEDSHSISGLLNRLEDMALVTRERQKRDRRVVCVGLTEAGADLTEESIERVLGMSRDLKSVIEGQDVIAVVREVRDIGLGIMGMNQSLRREASRRVWLDDSP